MPVAWGADSCPSGQYVTTKCSGPDNNTVCKTCPIGFYQDADNYDAQCKPCTAEEKKGCTEYEQYYLGCDSTGGVADASCVGCDSCPSGQYVTTKCSGPDNNTVCKTCPIGFYQDADNYDAQCKLCTAEEKKGCTEYEQYYLGCDSTGGVADASCVGCDSCPSGQYVTTKCTGPDNNTVCKTCKEGYYKHGDNFDTKCTECSSDTTLQCTDKQYFTACDVTENARCVDCSTCGPGSVVTTMCTGPDNPTKCEACEAGYYNDADNFDKDCTLCTSEETLNCTGTQYYATCTKGSTKDASCVTCDGCGPGTKMVSMCTGPDNPTVCTACLINQEQSENNWYGACTDCDDGYYAPEGSSACLKCTTTICTDPTTKRGTCGVNGKDAPCEDCPADANGYVCSAGQTLVRRK